ncbi:hypothetical protein ACI0FR_02445 [Paenochrobactrum sp. BZR 201-1]
MKLVEPASFPALSDLQGRGRHFLFSPHYPHFFDYLSTISSAR